MREPVVQLFAIFISELGLHEYVTGVAVLLGCVSAARRQGVQWLNGLAEGFLGVDFGSWSLLSRVSQCEERKQKENEPDDGGNFGPKCCFLGSFLLDGIGLATGHDPETDDGSS